jgi:hypothetical protein
VFGHLVFVDDRADLDADPVRAAEPAGVDGGQQRGEQGLGGGEQVGPFAGAFGGQGGVAAGNQAFAGVGDLGQVLGVEEGQFQRAPVGGEFRGRRPVPAR